MLDDRFWLRNAHKIRATNRGAWPKVFIFFPLALQFVSKFQLRRCCLDCWNWPPLPPKSKDPWSYDINQYSVYRSPGWKKVSSNWNYILTVSLQIWNKPKNSFWGVKKKLIASTIYSYYFLNGNKWRRSTYIHSKIETCRVNKSGNNSRFSFDIWQPFNQLHLLKIRTNFFCTDKIFLYPPKGD